MGNGRTPPFPIRVWILMDFWIKLYIDCHLGMPLLKIDAKDTISNMHRCLHKDFYHIGLRIKNLEIIIFPI